MHSSKIGKPIEILIQLVWIGLLEIFVPIMNVGERAEGGGKEKSSTYHVVVS